VPAVDWILVTNDDGVDAPALPELARAIATLAPVRVVAPDRERSWVGKAITRYEPVRVEVVERHGVEMHAVSGYPADCAQLGIHALFDEPPRLVVSGINAGFNHGSAYIQSSGTVGAALEASISGVDALALSAQSLSHPWTEWRLWSLRPESTPMWERLAGIAAYIAAPIFAAAPQGVVINVNMPDDADLSTPRRLTAVADVGYDRLFRKASEGVFVHDYRGYLNHFSSLAGTDVQASTEGVVAMTALRATHTAEMPEVLRLALGL
jgi:5'-nucleotidase